MKEKPQDGEINKDIKNPILDSETPQFADIVLYILINYYYYYLFDKLNILLIQTILSDIFKILYFE